MFSSSRHFLYIVSLYFLMQHNLTRVHGASQMSADAGVRQNAGGEQMGPKTRFFCIFDQRDSGNKAEGLPQPLKPPDVSLGTALGGGAAVDEVPEAVEEGFGRGVNSES